MNDWNRVAERLGNISRSKVFELWKTNDLGSVKIGRRRFSTDRQIAEYIANLEERAA